MRLSRARVEARGLGRTRGLSPRPGGESSRKALRDRRDPGPPGGARAATGGPGTIDFHDLALGEQSISRDLSTTARPFVDASWLAAYVTPPDKQTAETRATLRLSDELVAEVLATDHIVIGTPVYNYNAPASLKAWIDHVVRRGLTLGFRGEGLLVGRRAHVLLASGGVYTPDSPIHDRDIASRYLQLILDVLGIEDVSTIAAGGAKAVDLGEVPRATFLAPVFQAIAADLG